VRFLGDGSLEYLGRLDQQVKLRGFRVEPGEVEATLRAHADVRDVVVTVRNRNTADARLVAYIVPARLPVPSHSAWSGFLKDKLPDYMIPAAFVHIQDVPLTPNGKVDHLALPEPDHRRPDLHESFVAPQQPVERRVAEIVSAVLGIDRVGLHDNFFELGGHSLMIFQVIFRLHDTFSVELPVRDFFDHPTVAGLTRVIEEQLILQAAPQEIAQAMESLDSLSADEIRALLSDEADQS
jgi:acyl carrier protein